MSFHAAILPVLDGISKQYVFAVAARNDFPAIFAVSSGNFPPFSAATVDFRPSRSMAR